METKEKWNLIVKQYKENYNSVESKIQSLWELYCSEFLGYSKLLREFSTQENKGIGSRERVIPDIILKKGNENIFDIELKQYNLKFSTNMENQLKSYLELFHMSIGMIVCDKIYLYSYCYGTREVNSISIDFCNDNPDGIKLLELLNKDNIDEIEIKKYIKSENEKRGSVKKIKETLTPKLIESLVWEYFRSKYQEEEVRAGLKDISFDIIKKNDTHNLSAENTRNMGFSGKKPLTNDGKCEDFPFEPKFIIIKTTYERVKKCDNNLYDATRHCWMAGKRVNDYQYVLAVIDKQVREVYKVKSWYHAKMWENDEKDVTGRWEFDGEVAPDNIRDQWMNKIIPVKFRKQGMASPLLYSDMRD